MQFFKTYWIETLLCSGFLLSVATRNKTMWVSILVVLLLRVFRVSAALDLLSAKGVNWAIVLLTVGFLAPIASGKYSLEQLKAVFLTPEGWIAICCGILVALLGAKGIAMGQTDMLVIVGVMVGTFLGVALFKGSPMGPLIGSGMAFVAITAYRWAAGLFLR